MNAVTNTAVLARRQPAGTPEDPVKGLVEGRRLASMNGRALVAVVDGGKLMRVFPSGRTEYIGVQMERTLRQAMENAPRGRSARRDTRRLVLR